MAKLGGYVPLNGVILVYFCFSLDFKATVDGIFKGYTLITKKFGRKNFGREIIGREIFGRFFSKFRTKFRTKSQIVISKNLQNLGRKCGNEALKRIKMNELRRSLIVEIVKSKFHQIKKKIIKKKWIWW